jgi:hypothetical protein
MRQALTWSLGISCLILLIRLYSLRVGLTEFEAGRTEYEEAGRRVPRKITDMKSARSVSQVRSRCKRRKDVCIDESGAHRVVCVVIGHASRGVCKVTSKDFK